MKLDSKVFRARFYALNSIRMCITCKKRFLQCELVRFKARESNLLLYNGSGRSFYVCCDCLTRPKTINNIKRYIKYTNHIEEQLKEIAQTWQALEK